MSIIEQRIMDSIAVKQKMLAEKNVLASIQEAADIIINCLKRGGKLVIGGNGGSESDSLHFAGEIVGRFQQERAAWPAIVMGADPATMTAIANDYGYEEAYARQARAFVHTGDILFVISTSGNSRNLIRAVKAVENVDCKTIALLGRDGGKLREIADCSIVIPADVTARIQESHITVIHILCELIEEAMRENG